MSNPIRVIPAASDEWDSWIARVRHDFPHTAGYHRLSEAQGEGRAFLAVYGCRERFLAWPYLLRKIGDCEGLEGSEFNDVTSVYGYPGPLAYGCLAGDHFLREASEALREAWNCQKVVCAFSRFHPLLENHRWVMGDGRPFGELCYGGRTVSINLQDTDPTQSYKRALRQHLHRGRALGMTTQVDPDLDCLGEFVRIYTHTMQRNRAAQCYFHRTDYFRRFKDQLGAHVFLASCRIGERIAAAAWVVEYNGVANPHLGGTSREFLAVSPFKVLLDDLRQWARERGNHTLYLGGGRGGRHDSLFRFKAEFSSRRHDFYTWRWILDAEAYQALCSRHEGYLRESGRKTADTDYFPAYRAPIEQAVPDAPALVDL